MSDPRAHPKARTAGSNESPDLGESLREVGGAARAGLKQAGNTAKAFRVLMAADVSLARSAMGRTLAMTAVAIVFGASCWLFLMATLVVFLTRQLGLPWAVSMLLAALASGAVASWAAWRADFYFDHTRMQATRRQLARLGIGELADFTPDADSPASARANAEQSPPTGLGGQPPRGKDGVEVSPP